MQVSEEQIKLYRTHQNSQTLGNDCLGYGYECLTSLSIILWVHLFLLLSIFVDWQKLRSLTVNFRGLAETEIVDSQFSWIGRN